MSASQTVQGLPESVPIGAVDFEIVPIRGPLETAADIGLIDYEDLSIKIHEAAPRYRQVQALFHEIAHATLDRTGLGHLLTEPQQEAFCDVVGYMLADLLEQRWLAFTKSDKR